MMEIKPPLYEQVRENETVSNFKCPKCNGRCGFTEEVGRNEYRDKTCDYCDGTGKIKAEILINWKPDYGTTIV